MTSRTRALNPGQAGAFLSPSTGSSSAIGPISSSNGGTTCVANYRGCLIPPWTRPWRIWPSLAFWPSLALRGDNSLDGSSAPAGEVPPRSNSDEWSPASVAKDIDSHRDLTVRRKRQVEGYSGLFGKDLLLNLVVEEGGRCRALVSDAAMTFSVRSAACERPEEAAAMAVKLLCKEFPRLSSGRTPLDQDRVAAA